MATKMMKTSDKHDTRSTFPLHHRLEACFWLTRSSSIALAVLAPPVWYVHGGATLLQLLALVVAIALFGALVQVLNDIFDRHADAMSAPYLPLPAGLVSLRAAAMTAAVLGIGTILAVLAAAPGPGSGMAGCAVLLLVAVTLRAYSVLKRRPLLGPACHGFMTATLSVGCWVTLDGGVPTLGLAAVVGFAALFGVAGNINSTLRDIDAGSDVEDTVGLRLGMLRTSVLVVALDLICIGLALLLGWHLYGAVPWGLTVVAFGAAAWRLATCFRLIQYLLSASHNDCSSSRADRLADIKAVAVSRIAVQSALFAVFDLLLAALVVVLFLGLAAFDGLYSRRIVRGGLLSAGNRASPDDNVAALADVGDRS